MKNNTENSLNIFNLLELLQKKEFTKEELQKKFNIKSQTFYKYMKYFKDAGYDIQKRKNKVGINKYANNIKLNNSDIDLITNICLLSEKVLTGCESNKVKEIVNKILLAADSNSYKQVVKKLSYERKMNNFKEYKMKIDLFETFLKNNTLVKVIIKSKNTFKARPYKITLQKGRVYFNFITDEGKTKSILADRIIDIQPENLIKTINRDEKETIFELYGNLAKTYVLRENEVIISNFEKGIRIANTEKDKNLLFKRLLRYDILCKIIYPNSDKIKFKKMINTALSNIGGD